MQNNDNHPQNDKAPGGGQRHVYTPAARAGRPGAGRTPSAGQPAAPAGKPANGAAKRPPAKKPAGLMARIRRMSRGTKIITIAIALAVVVLIALLLAIFVPGCMQQGTPSSSASQGSSSAASGIDPSYDPGANSIPAAQYQGTILEETEELSATELKEYLAETLFLGDSNTERMHAFRDATGLTRQNSIGVEGMSVSEFTYKQVVKFSGHSTVYTMPQAVEMLQPLRVMMNFGTNDIGWHSIDDFIDNYTKAIEAVQDAYPYASIIISSIFPVEHSRSYTTLTMARIDEYNLALVELAKKMDCKFLNWTDALRDNSTGYAVKGSMLDDGIHLNSKGMQLAFDYFRSHTLQVEDSRPKPLADRPTVAGAVQPDRPPASSSYSSAADTIAVSFAAGEGGLVEISGSQKASFAYSLKPGEATPQAKAIAKDGYVFKYWTATGYNLASSANATLASFTIPTNMEGVTAIKITAVFEAKSGATVTFGAGAGGTISPSGAITLAPGVSSGVYTATPNDGYTFAGWTCSAGSMTASGNGYVFTLPANHDVATPVTVVANFTQNAPTTETITFTVNVVVAGGTADIGGVQASYTLTRTIGQDTTFTLPAAITVTPNDGSTIDGQPSASYSSVFVPGTTPNGGVVTLNVTLTPAAPEPEPPAGDG